MSDLSFRLLAVLLLALSASLAAGDDDGWDDIEEKQPQQNNINNWLADPDNLDRWVFQQAGNAAEQRKRFQIQLELSLREFESSCGLSESQKRRLELAGKLDIADFFAEYDRIRGDIYAGEPDQEDFNNIWQLIQPLQIRVQAGLIDDDSLFRKVSLSVLDAEQGEAFSRTEHARRQFRYRAAVKLYLMQIDSTMPLQATQRKALVEFALRETKAPNRCHPQSLQLYVQCQLGQLKPDAIRELDLGEQGDLLVKLFKRGRGYEHHLRQQGIHPHDE